MGRNLISANHMQSVDIMLNRVTQKEKNDLFSLFECTLFKVCPNFPVCGKESV